MAYLLEFGFDNSDRLARPTYVFKYDAVQRAFLDESGLDEKDATPPRADLSLRGH